MQNWSITIKLNGGKFLYFSLVATAMFRATEGQIVPHCTSVPVVRLAYLASTQLELEGMDTKTTYPT